MSLGHAPGTTELPQQPMLGWYWTGHARQTLALDHGSGIEVVERARPCGLAAPLRREVWTLADGQRLEGWLVGTYWNTVEVGVPCGRVQIPLHTLSEDMRESLPHLAVEQAQRRRKETQVATAVGVTVGILGGLTGLGLAAYSGSLGGFGYWGA
ncbi:MAG: hypothetical protein H6738_04220 [Alphaproteobacteria bacterium]|nr:hypothetical protein [Alphaproteobacteria bacterium]MCB9695977.1 hypothetical protein [Alphaproteobacteria bacterium]